MLSLYSFKFLMTVLFFRSKFIELHSKLPCHALKKSSENINFDKAEMLLKEIQYILSHAKIR